MTTTEQDLDTIERSIDIGATPERVFALVSVPGWWINDGTEVDPDPQIRREGDLDVVTHAEHGEFRLRTEASDAPRYVRFHWVDNVAPEAGTTVEFWIEDRPGGVTLKVKESGFASLQKDRAAIDHQIGENTEGWETELAVAKRGAERAA